MVQQVPPPKRPPRQHEWTRAKMAAFLRELAATLSVSRAAHSVGMSRQSAYKLRKRMAGQPFAQAWQMACAAPRGAFSRGEVSSGRPAVFSRPSA